MLEVKRKDGENFETLIRRFTKKTLQSGRIIQAKKVMFFQKPLSEKAQKERAKNRDKVTKLREYLRKIDKLDEYNESKKKGKSKRR